MARFWDIVRQRRTLLSQFVGIDAKLHTAQSLVNEALQEAHRARDEFEQQRGPAALPNIDNPDSLDLHIITALDHYHQIHQAVEIPLREARTTWEDSVAARAEVRRLSRLMQSVVSRSARVAFYDQLKIFNLTIGGLKSLLSSKLTDNVLSRMAANAKSKDSHLALQRYRMNNAAFIAALDRLNFYTSETSPLHRRGIHGGLPSDIATAIEAAQLLQGPLRAMLRRYQEFGARYLIVQKRSLLGDDMGLGKTVQVLAAMSHLYALGSRHFLVIAPNSVLINWERETAKHTDLVPHVVHGSNREDELVEWLRDGGIAITTYGTIAKILHLIPRADFIAVDEAHYIKNPQTQRSQAVQQLLERSEYVTLMTGTALENRLSELQFLITAAQPEIEPVLHQLINMSSSTPHPDLVVQELAPVYLRRTQADVLRELPERITSDEWVVMGPQEHDFYLHAEPDLMTKRLAAITGTPQVFSAKYQRLYELAEEHIGENRKIVVFSYFRSVIDTICELFPGTQQITGSTSSVQRQKIIDSFAVDTTQHVLAAQIDAGGIGVNLQFAQVVILMEPQLKPSTESQAIARVHRMGQSRTVLVHRLLARNTIDEKLVELINAKTQIFMDYAHDSAIRDASLMAVDPQSGDIEAELRQWLKTEEG